MKFSDHRDLICMIERVNYINELYDWLPSKDKAKFCGNGTLDTLKYKTTFATPGKVRDGIDAPWKDCLIMTSPISNIKQLTGRIVRESENKKTPSVIDLVDYGCTYMSRTFYKRRNFYIERDWKIQYFLFKGNKLHNIDETIAIDIIEGK